MLGVAVQIDGYDPVAGAAVTLRAGSHDDAAVCHLTSDTWWPALTKMPTLRYDLFDGAFGGQITAPSSSLRLSVEPWPNFARYALADARLRLWTGEVGTAWSAWTLRFDGLVSEQPEMEDGQADVSFAVDDRWLDNALLATYAGTTGAEGGADLKGQPKPLALGAPRYVAGTLIDPVNSIIQVSGYGAVQGIDAAMEKLARFGSAAADYASHAALLAASVPAGRWATAKAVGMARFGAPPVGQVSFLVSGDAAGPDGWARKPGQMIRRLALLSGGSGKISDASLNALDTARPYNISLYVDQQTTARQLIQQIAASVNAVAVMSWTGQLFVVPVAIGTATVTLAADGSALPPVGKVKQVAIASPFKKLAIGAERAWMVHALADIAFTATLVDMGAYASGTTYREGNLVQSGGSSWLYINPTPTSGHTPPTLPTTEDAYWRVLAKAGSDGSDGAAGAPGTPGTDGADGTPGAPGADGQATYVHVAYATNATGTAGFSTTDGTGKTYIGTFTDQTLADSTNPADYTWSLIKGADGSDGSDGAPGTPGEAAVVLDVSTTTIIVQADSSSVTKTGQLPRYTTATVMSGATDVTGSASLSVTPSSTAIAASISGGAITISQADASGYIDVTGSYSGAALATKRIQITRQQDAPPPASSTSQSGAVDLTVSATSYGSDFAEVMTLRANGSGALVFSGGGEYICPGATSVRTFRMAGRPAYRAAGSGTLSYGAEVLGTTATTLPSSDPTAGSITVSETLTGLTPGAFYEVTLALLKYSGTSGGTAAMTGSETVSQ